VRTVKLGERLGFGYVGLGSVKLWKIFWRLVGYGSCVRFGASRDGLSLRSS
jgi:hypothetical protein